MFFKIVDVCVCVCMNIIVYRLIVGIGLYVLFILKFIVFGMVKIIIFMKFIINYSK